MRECSPGWESRAARAPSQLQPGPGTQLCSAPGWPARCSAGRSCCTTTGVILDYELATLSPDKLATKFRRKQYSLSFQQKFFKIKPPCNEDLCRQASQCQGKRLCLNANSIRPFPNILKITTVCRWHLNSLEIRRTNNTECKKINGLGWQKTELQYTYCTVKCTKVLTQTV